MTLTQSDVDEIENRLKETFVTKEDFVEYKSNLFNKLDQIVQNTSNTNTEVELLESRVSKTEDALQVTK